MIQLLPGAGEDVIAKVEGSLMAAGPVTGLLRNDPDPEAMLRHALSDFDLEILERSPIEYRCYCSRDRMERALISLGPEELQAMIDEQGSAGVDVDLLKGGGRYAQQGDEQAEDQKKSKKAAFFHGNVPRSMLQ